MGRGGGAEGDVNCTSAIQHNTSDLRHALWLPHLHPSTKVDIIVIGVQEGKYSKDRPINYPAE